MTRTHEAEARGAESSGPDSRPRRTRKRAGLCDRSPFQAIFDRLPGAVLVLDPAGRILQQNGQARAMACAGEPGSGQVFHDLRSPEGALLPREELPAWRALTRGESVTGVELALQAPDGRLVPVLVSARPLPTPRGMGAVVVFQDMPGLEGSRRQREEWGALVAHDLRQPLATLAFDLELLLRPRANAQRQRDRLERMRSVTRRMARMVRDLLDASRVESHRLTLERRPVDVGELVARVTEELGESIPRLAVHWACEPGAIAFVDPDRVEQVLENLLLNAAKYGTLGTETEVRVARRGREVEVTVANRGDEIPAERLATLFSRFARGRGSEVPGLGLGLYISRGIALAHGGDLRVESAPPGLTTFRLTLPLHDPHA